MDREKQIEEIAKALCIYDDGNSYCFRRQCDKKCRYGKFAKALYEAGYTKQPTADVVKVVRCKDCAVPHNRWTGCPKLNGLVTPPDFYCNYGERRKEDEGK